MNRSLLALVAGVALAGLLAGSWYATRDTGDDVFAPCRAGAIAGGAGTVGGPFELVNAQGLTVTEAEVITEPSILYFGYTYCPDVCPLDVARNAEAVDLLAERGVSATPVFISIDPVRDTPQVVGEFAAAMHEKMIGLTGSPEQVKAAADAYRTYFRAQESGDDFYLVDHSTFSYLVLPGHGFVEFFRREASPEQVAESVACFVKRA